MSGLIENYLREVDASLRADPERKRQIVEELRSHLRDKVADLRRAQPERPQEDVEREVLHDFGSPRDLALAYEPDGLAVLKNRAGDTVLRLGAAMGRGASYVGRGVGKTLKVVAVSLAVLLVVALGVGAWAYHEFKPYLLSAAEDSVPVYDYRESCAGTPCTGALPEGTFYVKPEARNLRFSFSIDPAHAPHPHDATHVGGGSVVVRVQDPTGAVRYDRALNMTNGTRLDQSATWAAIEGNWTVTLEYQDFVGRVEVQAYAWSAPWIDP